MSDDTVVKFERRKINEWPREVYLADMGDGDGCRPYGSIQYPDDTTPRYIRADLHEARVRELEAENVPVTVEEAARVILTDNSAIDSAFDACDPAIEKMAIDYAGNRLDAVGQLEIAEDFFRAALRALAGEGE